MEQTGQEWLSNHPRRFFFFFSLSFHYPSSCTVQLCRQTLSGAQPESILAGAGGVFGVEMGVRS